MTATSLVLHLGAVGALLAVAIAQFTRHLGDALYWGLLGLAAAAPIAWSVVQLESGWGGGFSLNLWISVSAAMMLFVPIALVAPAARRLTVLLTPYLGLLAVLATLWAGQEPDHAGTAAPSAWLAVHIVTAIATYALLTLAAVAGLAVFLQERALKRRQPDRLTRALPALADAEALQDRLLVASEAVLGLGLATGMATQLLTDGRLLVLDHKTLLTIAAFLVIGSLLIAQHRSGLRGRRAARFVLIAYLLLTLGYPGVKFVTDILIG